MTPKVILTNHAVERFIERVAPGLDFEDAKVKIVNLILVGEFSSQPPDWKEAIAMEWIPDTWLIIGDICFPLVENRAVTCIVKGSLPGNIREARNRENRKYRAGQRAKRAAKRFGSGYQGPENRKENWNDAR